MNNVDVNRYSKRIVQFFWDPEPRNDDTNQAPIWCLGRKYENRCKTIPNGKPSTTPVKQSLEQPASDSRTNISHENGLESRSSSFEQVEPDENLNPPMPNGGDEGWPEGFLDDFEARIWLTYRSNFPAIPKSTDPKATSGMSLSVRLKSQLASQAGFTSDTGWGCMIRSGQSLVANALAVLWFGRERKRSTHVSDEKTLLSLFADDPQAPFSIHKFVEYGASACGTYPGQWFGPSATAKCIQALSNDCQAVNMKVYVTGDGPDIYEDQLLQIAKSGSSVWTPTLLLVGTRLGIDRITPVYWDVLKASLQMPQSVGIAGGRPSSSHYFIGSQGNSFFYLDPHHTRPALPFHASPSSYTSVEIDSCHTRRLRRLPIEEMDPSMLIAFLFREESDWDEWRKAVAETPGKAIFHVKGTERERYGFGSEREGAVDEVEILDDEEGEDEGFGDDDVDEVGTVR